MKLGIIFIAITLAAGTAAGQSAPANDALFRAIRSSDLGAVRTALWKGASPNATSADGDTPLMYAAVYSTSYCMQLLLQRGADSNARDKRGGTALMRSVRDIDKVRLLLAAGAEVDARSARGVTALMIAANRPGSVDVVKLLLQFKADPTTPDAAGVPPLMYAADFGDLESVQVLVAAGADVNTGRRNGATPVYWAASGPLDVVVWFLAHKADPNTTRGSAAGRTPLMEAAFFGATANVKALLDAGANVNATSDRGTALIWAAGSDLADADMIRLLLERGADPNAVATRCSRCIHEPRSDDGSTDLTALMLAKQRGETEIVRMLVASGAKR